MGTTSRTEKRLAFSLAFWPSLLAAVGCTGCVGYRSPLLDGTEPRGRCNQGEAYILLLGDDDNLYHFDPGDLTLAPLGRVGCGGQPLNSMTASRIGPAYLANRQGVLCVVDLKTLRSTITPLDSSRLGRQSYGMALLPDNDGRTQSLFVAGSVNNSLTRLFRIGLLDYQVSEIGRITPQFPYVEMAAGPEDKLYGLGLGSSEATLFEINPDTAAGSDVIPVPTNAGRAAFALVYWQDRLYLFSGESYAGSAEVFSYRKEDAAVVPIGKLNVGIGGAGVALCQ